MAIAAKRVSTPAFSGQKPGTSGLRKRVAEFAAAHYVAAFAHATLDAVFAASAAAAAAAAGGGGGHGGGATVIVGGDGRYFSASALRTIAGVVAARADVARLVVGVSAPRRAAPLAPCGHGILSTPAASALIRELNAAAGAPCVGGFLLTASHNPGGPDGDFGIKWNVANGAPAPESLTNAIYAATQRLDHYDTIGDDALPAAFVERETQLDVQSVDGTTVRRFTIELVDAVDVYERLLASVFSFDRIGALLARPDFRPLFHAMNGVMGPYVERILVERLGAAPSACLGVKPLPDFGGLHPDPNLHYGRALVDALDAADSVFDFGAAFDGDGDRNMILGRRFFVTPSDSLAVIAEHAGTVLPYFADGVKALARSMPTSCALDRVAAQLGVRCFEVPTGWKFFSNIMDAFRDRGTPHAVICGEESFGTGSDHIREKDGMWAVLAWLSVLAATDAGARPSVEGVVRAHWRKFGRTYYTRHDYEEVESAAADGVMRHLVDVVQRRHNDGTAPLAGVSLADEFEYRDEFDGSVTSRQGVRFLLDGGAARVIFRLSGTGTAGATLRLYVERFDADGGAEGAESDVQRALAPLIAKALEWSQMAERTGRSAPTVVT